MKLSAFLRDRLAYIAVYIGFGILSLTVVQLDLWLSGSSLQFSNLLYIGLLGLAGLVLFLFIEHQRHAAFARGLAALTGKEPLDELQLLPEAHTLQQAMFAHAWAVLYARLRSELNEETERGHRQVHLITQWAHHMKTPVSVIDLELQKARKQPCPPEIGAALASVDAENQRLQHSLHMLLNTVRLESFAADFSVAQVDLEALVRQLIHDQKRAFIVQKVYPKVETLSGPVIVASDAKWLRFVLEQVLSNAIKYSCRPGQDGHVRFRIYKEGTERVLEIADDGIGIAYEDLGRVFSPFYTGANGRDYPQSTGMGLYLAREVCQRLGHQISVRSQQGVGTQVYLRFAPDQTIFAGLSPAAPKR